MEESRTIRHRDSAGRLSAVAAALWVGAGVGSALAQGVPGGLQPGAPLRLVEQGVGDADPLARSLRQLPIDLRAPLGFDRVYDLGDGRLARIDGGLVAVFERSTYTQGSTGPVATVPPGTVFHIGLPADVRARLNVVGDPNWRPTRASPFVDVVSRGPEASRPPSRDARELFGGPERRASADPVPMHQPVAPTPSIFTSEQERTRVVRSLMERARQAGGVK